MSDFNDVPLEEEGVSTSQHVTFHAQSGILNRYAHQSDPHADPTGLRVILDVLRKNKELRRRFFELRPDVAWLDVLWKEDFFRTPPEIETLVNAHGWFRFWDVQEFLITHASSRAHYVVPHLEHLNALRADPIFLNAGLRTLEKLLPEHPDTFEAGLPLALAWLEDFQLAASLAHTAVELIETCVKNHHRAAFDILGALVKPHPNPNAKPLGDHSIFNAEAIAALDPTSLHRLEDAEEKKQLFTRLRKLDFEALLKVWELRLIEAIAIEAKTRGYEGDSIGDSTWWRQAIEDSDQDNAIAHKDFLLTSLRDILEDQVSEDIELVRPHIARYLAHPSQILRRLGLHLLRTFSHQFLDTVVEELLVPENYRDTIIHHEFFGLLADGFPLLNPLTQRQVLDIILRGPSSEYLDNMVEWGLTVRQSTPQELRQIYLEAWQRDRLWMIRSHLSEAEKSLLADITGRLSEPEHPSFTSYSSGVGFIASVSPLSRDDLSQLTPFQLWQFLESWQPPSRASFDFTETNWEGLAGEVAAMIRDDLPRYVPFLLPMFKLRPRMAQALINITLALNKPDKEKAPSSPPVRGTFRGIRRGRRWRRHLRTSPEPSALNLTPLVPVEAPSAQPSEEILSTETQGEVDTTEEPPPSATPLSTLELWELRLQVAEVILADAALRVDMTPHFDGGWPAVRRNIVSLLKDGLAIKDERQVPDELLPRVLNTLLAFAEDPDPDFGSDRPQKGWFGYNDPLTVSLNHVRPAALGALEAYSFALSRRGLDGHPPTGVGPSRLQPEVASAFTAHLDRDLDPSRAVRAVFGRYLGGLYWLDKPWVEANLDAIFPWAEDDETRWYFAAAWDAFIVSNSSIYLSLYETMRTIYARAIEAMAAGFVSDTHLQTIQSFAAHLFVEYFSRPYDLTAPASANNLLRLFMEKATPEQRGQVAWMLWRMVADHKAIKEGSEEEPPEVECIGFTEIWLKAREFWQWRVDESSERGYPADFDEEMQWLCYLLETAPETETIKSLHPLLFPVLQHLGRKDGRLNVWDRLEEFVADEVEADPVTSVQFYIEMHTQMPRPLWVQEDKARFILETGAASDQARFQTLTLLDLLSRRGESRFDDIFQRWAGIK